MNDKTQYSPGWLMVFPIACVLWTVALLWWGTVWKLALPDGETLVIWHWRAMPFLRWPLAVVTLALVAWSARRMIRLQPRSHQAWLLTPLIFTPLPALPALFADLLSRHVVSNTIFFGWVAVTAWFFSRVYSAEVKHRLLTGPSGARRIVWVLFIIGACAYGYGGYYFSTHAGEHMGDEAHYRIQAQSLYEHGDLDLQRYITDEKGHLLGSKAHFHIAKTSRAPHAYSWHPPGLSFIAVPLWPWGMAGRHVLLGLIAGAGLAGIFLLARESGAGSRASLGVSLALGASTYWTLYAFRFLPETLGATLLLWSFYAVTVQRRRPWLAVVLAIAMNGYLPFAHTRFLPLSLMAFGFFGLMGLFGGTPERWTQRLLRLAVFSLLSLGFYAVYAYLQFNMFDGGSAYPVGSTLFSYLPGAWEVFADARGAAPILPLLYWLIPAALVWPWKDRSQPIFSLGLLLTVIACVLTSCTNRVSVGGACVQGRYLLVVVPLLAPGAAWCLSRAGSRQVSLFAALTAVSILPLFFLLFWIPELGRDFAQPFRTIGSQPLFDGIFMPYTGLRSTHLPAPVFLAATFAPLALLIALLCLHSGARRAGWTLTTLSLASLVYVHASTIRSARVWTPNDATPLLNRVHVQHVRMARMPDGNPRNFFELFGNGFRDFNMHGQLALTTEGLPATEPPLFREKDIDRNDWDGRPYRWFTLTGPFPPSPGPRILHVSGTVSGNARPFLAIKEGAHVRAETAIPVEHGHWQANQPFDLEGKKGDLYVLLRMEGEGVWGCEIDRLFWSRFHPRMLEDANLRLGNEFSRTSGPVATGGADILTTSTNAWGMPGEEWTIEP